jgi:hypothetical protein
MPPGVDESGTDIGDEARKRFNYFVQYHGEKYEALYETSIKARACADESRMAGLPPAELVPARLAYEWLGACVKAGLVADPPNFKKTDRTFVKVGSTDGIFLLM